ncbi:MAG: hypothetical protein CVU90_06375 [Firmicutes bacterium HGW-Firmicutes-15]|nr:MAG: hypothetical protein CVU90_06375 [Firmicutes bacterium HGW-Firmicutes-15]
MLKQYLTVHYNKPVTCLEAIVILLNAQGLNEEVKNYQLSEEQQVLLQKIPDWGRNHIALALERGVLLEKNMKIFNPHQGAKRYEVFQYMTRLLEGQSGSDDEKHKRLQVKRIYFQSGFWNLFGLCKQTE